MTSQGAKPAAADLLKEFRNLADALGGAFDFGVRPERYRRTPERAARVARMNALVPEMRSQIPAETLTALMEDENTDARAWAAMRFHDLDEDLSHAATIGLYKNVSTREALNAIAHARKPPPKHPTLPDMSVAELVARFADACLREFWARHTGSDDDPMGPGAFQPERPRSAAAIPRCAQRRTAWLGRENDSENRSGTGGASARRDCSSEGRRGFLLGFAGAQSP
jgi:hypothetical protein